jgi:hypothetical protein
LKIAGKIAQIKESEKMQNIYWSCLDMGFQDNRFIQSVFEELSNLLTRRMPCLEADFQCLPDVLAAKVADILRQDPELSFYAHFASAIADVLPTIPPWPTRLLLYCLPDSPIARAFKSSSRIWGATCRPLAVVWNLNNKYLIWHEVFHLLGAQDCYDKNGHGPICEITNCIMQYEPTDKNVGQWPFLCAKNIERICSRP